MNRTIDLRLHSLSFAGTPGALDAPIHLADARMNKWLDPVQWVNEYRNLPAAFVRGSRPSLVAELEAEYFAFPDFNLSAYGSFNDAPSAATPLLGPLRVQLSPEDLGNHFVTTDAIKFNVPLPDAIGRHTLHLDWYAEQGGPNPRRLFVGHSVLTILTAWKPMVLKDDWFLDEWAYSTVMEWSCVWAQGAADEAQICRQLMDRLPGTGLQYGLPAWGIRSMLAVGGGMCGGWQELFSQLANCQGVALTPQTLKLPADDLDPWGDLVVTDPGLNQRVPSFISASLGHYQDSDQLAPVTERRYRFDQDPNGHSVNMLALPGGKVTIYDPSFRRTAEGLAMKMPKVPGERATYEAGHPFRSAYFDQAVHALTKVSHVVAADPLDWGRSVITADITDPVTLVWNNDPKHKVKSLTEQLERVLATYFTKEDARALKRKLGLGGGRWPPSARALPSALRAARALQPRRDAPISHSMSPVELVQYLLIQLAHGPPRPRRAAAGIPRPSMAMTPMGPPPHLPRPKAPPDEDKNELARLSRKADSARLRALARYALRGGSAGGRSRGRRPPAR